jgi:outer membrane protein
MRLIPLGLLFLAGLTAEGQTAPATNHLQPISLAECMRLALLHNRDLQIQRYNPELARLTLSGSYGAYDPVLASGYRHTHDTDTGGYTVDTLQALSVYDAESHVANAGLSGDLPIGMSYDLSGNYVNTWGGRNGSPFETFNTTVAGRLTQHLLKNFWTDQARTTIEVNKRDLKITELGVDYRVMDVITRVEKAYYELIYTHEYVKVGEKLVEVRQRFYDETRQKIELGKLAPLEARLAQSQLARVQADLISAHNRVTLAENQLKSLLADDFVSSVDRRLTPSDSLVVLPETFDLGGSWRQGLAQRPDLLQLKLDVEKANLELKYRFNQLFPSLDMVAGYGLKGNDQLVLDGTGGQAEVIHDASSAGAFGQIRSRLTPNDFLGVVFSVPLSRTSDRANYKASKVRKAQAEVLVKQREEVILREIDDALKTARTSLERITATREATAYARAALEAEEKKLAAGTSTSYVVLQLQGELASAAVDELRAKADYSIALAQLHFVEASVLQRYKIDIEIK